MIERFHASDYGKTKGNAYNSSCNECLMGRRYFSLVFQQND